MGECESDDLFYLIHGRFMYNLKNVLIKCQYICFFLINYEIMVIYSIV